MFALLRNVLLTTGAALTLATAPVTAQATPLGSGGGAFVGQNQETRWFAFSCQSMPDGSVTGQAVAFEQSSHSLLLMRITSATKVGGNLFVAGPVTMATNDTPFAVGQTVFFGIQDDPAGDFFIGPGAVPLQFGNLTIQQILALVGPPPPQAYLPLLLGNFVIY